MLRLDSGGSSDNMLLLSKPLVSLRFRREATDLSSGFMIGLGSGGRGGSFLIISDTSPEEFLVSSNLL